MPRGGKRPGAGRPKGSTEWQKKDLLRRIEGTDGDMVERLATVADDSEAPMKTRREAVRLLAGALYGKIVLDVKAGART